MFTRYRHIIILAILAFALAPIASKASGATPFTVVLDAGHGGRDHGCRGRLGKEKDITLDVVGRIAKQLSKAAGDSISVVMTRKDDTFIALDRRAAIANDAEADIFVSVHVNSIDRRSRGREKVHGASVYTVGLHKSEANLSVAMRENAVIELEEDFTTTYQDFDPNSSESYIIFELTQSRDMAQSVELASFIQNGLTTGAGRADKGVRQAGFLVLWATKMPSVLIELDFICNPEAERFLMSDKGRQKCADAITNAILAYRTKHQSAIKRN